MTSIFLAQCNCIYKVLISVTGGAQDFKLPAAKVDRVRPQFNCNSLILCPDIRQRSVEGGAKHGCLDWYVLVSNPIFDRFYAVDGGFDVGVMKYVGQALRDNDIVNVPCIGIATLNKVMQYQDLEQCAPSVRSFRHHV